MSPESSQMLLLEILPVLTATVPHTVYPAVGEDAGELVQDAVATAANMLENDEKAGRTSIPSSIAYYAIQRMKSGRRSHSASSTDVLSAYALRHGHFTVLSMEMPATGNDPGDAEGCCIGDALACRRDDPAVSSCRTVDWDEFLATRCRRDRLLLRALNRGHSLKRLAQRLRVSPPRITQIKQRIGRDLKLWMGDRILVDVQEETPWRQGLRAHRGEPDRDNDFSPPAA